MHSTIARAFLVNYNQDFGKPNMTNSHVEYLSTLKDLYYAESDNGYQFYAELVMPTESVIANGAPQVVYTCIKKTNAILVFIILQIISLVHDIYFYSQWCQYRYKCNMAE